MTISGTPVSLAPSDGDLVISGQTSWIGLGGLIINSLGGGSETASPSSLANGSVLALTGTAARSYGGLDRYSFLLSIMVAMGFGISALGL